MILPNCNTQHTMSRRYSEALPYLDSLLNCLICTEPYSSPKVLPCQHTFCADCLQRHYQYLHQQKLSIKNQLTCPTCRKKVILPTNGIAGLPNDFKVGQVKDFVQHLPKKDNQTDCDVCRFSSKNADASHYCAQCAKYLCERCTKHHSRSPLFRSHKAMAILTQDAPVLRCATHKEEIRYFCFECNKPVCTVCALSSHATHDIQEVQNAMREQQTNLKDRANTLATKLAEYEEKYNQLVSLKTEWDSAYFECGEAIRNQAKTMMEKVKENEQTLLDELAEIHTQRLEQIEKQEDGLTIKVNSLESLRDYLSSLTMQIPTDLGLFQSYPHLLSRIEKETSGDVDPIPTALNDKFEFIPNQKPTLGHIKTGDKKSTDSMESDNDTELAPLRFCEEQTDSPPTQIQVPTSSPNDDVFNFTKPHSTSRKSYFPEL